MRFWLLGKVLVMWFWLLGRVLVSCPVYGIEDLLSLFHACRHV